LPLITQSGDKTYIAATSSATNQAGNEVKPGRTPKKNVRRAGPFFFARISATNAKRNGLRNESLRPFVMFRF
jgi:hypothetical protein